MRICLDFSRDLNYLLETQKPGCNGRRVLSLSFPLYETETMILRFTWDTDDNYLINTIRQALY